MSIGATGPRGPTGAAGPTGATGATGATGPDWPCLATNANATWKLDDLGPMVPVNVSAVNFGTGVVKLIAANGCTISLGPGQISPVDGFVQTSEQAATILLQRVPGGDGNNFHALSVVGSWTTGP